MMKKLTEHHVTCESDYLNRRSFIKQSAKFSVNLAAFSVISPALSNLSAVKKADTLNSKKTTHGKGLSLTSYRDITNYNNFYEFGTGKRDPAKNSHTLKPKPWHIKVTGECKKTGNYDLEDFVKPYQLEERIYRFRCVEAWSMVIPWVGISLSSVLKTFQPNANAKYVVFKTLLDKRQMPWQKYPILDWPYIEGLTIAEAMNPLSMLSVGLYGKVLPNQNGAPLRLLVPWKYGFKNIKSIVSIHFQETQPVNTWQDQAASEYGFYANVNPNVDHPRWSQARERIIGKGNKLFPSKRKTELFNGYKDEVGHLYAGLDLKKNF